MKIEVEYDSASFRLLSIRPPDPGDPYTPRSFWTATMATERHSRHYCFTFQHGPTPQAAINACQTDLLKKLIAKDAEPVYVKPSARVVLPADLKLDLDF